ncbi:MAG: PAS domain S-box protein [Desulfarculaceae bacterium]|nr:PAS domain S-box protein [Desulfarculaceae bacterium]
MAIIYFAVFKLSILLASQKGLLTLFWPPAGVSLGAMLILGWRVAPAILVGSFLAGITSPGSCSFCLLSALGNTIAPLAGLKLLAWRGLDKSLERVSDVVNLAIWGGLVSGPIAASASLLGIAAGGLPYLQPSWHLWLSWWLGNSMGVILVTPVILTWATRPVMTWHPPRVWEATLWLAMYIAVGGLIFGGRISPDMADALDFLPFPLLVWAGLRFGRRLTSSASLLFCSGAVVAATLGMGPFNSQPYREALFLMWAYLGFLSLGALCLAAALGRAHRALKALSGHRDDLTAAVHRRTSELVGAAKALAESEERYRTLVEESPLGVSLIAEDGGYLYLNSSFTRMTGYSLEDLSRGSDWFRKAFPDLELRRQVISTWEEDKALAEPGQARPRTYPVRCKDGTVKEILFRPVTLSGGEQLVTYEDVSRRERAARALAESEGRQRALLDSLHEGVVLIDHEGVILSWNQAAAQITGFSPREVLGHNTLQAGWPLFLPDGSPCPPEQMPSRRVLANGQPISAELYIFRIGGRDRWITVNARPLFQEDTGRVAMISVSFSDITERMKADQALAESEEKFSKIFRHSPVWVVLTSLEEGRYLDVNQAFLDQTGWSREEVIGRTTDELGIRPDPSERQWMIERLREQGSLHDMEMKRHTKDGRELDVLFSGTIVEIAGVEYLLSLVQDITQRKAAEQALAESEEQYRLLVSTAQDAIYIIQDAKLVFANPMVERVTGRSAEELAGIPFSEVLHPDDRALARKRYKDRVAGKPTPDNYPMRVISGDGKVRWIQASAVHLSWKGRPAILYIARDITEQRRMETQLRQSQKLEAVGTLAGGIAHDFNNILAAIMGYAELSLGETQPGGQVALNLEQIITACLRARDLVSQILSFSRHSKHRLQPMQLAGVVEEVMRLIRATTPSNIDLHSNLDQESWVLGDPVQIHQLLMNLCTNATQAMEDRGGDIWVTVRRTHLSPGDELAGSNLLPGPYVRLSVADNGPGISPSAKERVFEPFFTTKEPGRGSGLGLSAVHGIVQGHHGAITLEDRMGGGAVFHVLLPEAEQQQAEAPPLSEPPRSRGNERLMFVDDEPALVEVASNILSKLGYQVEAFTASPEALDAFRSDPMAYDLVITDQTMPRLTGAALVRELKAIRPELPVIIATGFSHQLSPRQAREIGVAAFVMKPIATYEIAQAVRKALDQAQGQAPEDPAGIEDDGVESEEA